MRMHNEYPKWGRRAVCSALSPVFALAIHACAATVGDAPGDEDVDVVEQPLTYFNASYQVIDNSGRVLRWPASGSTPTMVTPSTSVWTSTGYSMRWVWGWNQSLISSGDIMRLVDGSNRSLRHSSTTPSLGAADAQANWSIVSTTGIGTIDVGERFTLQTTDNVPPWLLKSTSSGLRVDSSSMSSTAELRFSCYFPRGTRTSAWTTRPTYTAVTNPAGQVNQQNAVSWLRTHTVSVTTPPGVRKLVTWNDPTLGNAQVAYLVTDNLWASHAVAPYDATLSSDLRTALTSLGYYGNGLHDALFHDVGTTAHKPLDSDVVHGGYYGDCPVSDGTLTRLHWPKYGVDAGWTSGQTSQFIDSAIYEAMDQAWSGNSSGAKTRVRALLTNSGGSDAMFWDGTRRVFVDVASGGTNANAGFKLGLALYAMRVLGIDLEASFQTTANQIRTRLGEAQLGNGGIAHSITYNASGTVATRSEATGEATSIGILAHSVNRAF